ncbi:MAG: L-histidine N(alpha)-methyltransferase [Alphaproteobacteria bacterium]|nr:L-histidine N(alpha)-methyltransferase [Alphaproteobacteria bacterium]
MSKGTLRAYLDFAPREESFRDVALAGLTRHRKAIPCRFLYDARGSELFEAICNLPEYYVTRAEIALLAERAGEIAARIGPRARLIEFGSGASTKVRLLLAALDRPASYVPIDISGGMLHPAASAVAADFPALAVIAVCADYMEPLRLPALVRLTTDRRVGFFPGSTIGNLTPEEAVVFLRGCRELLGPGGAMIVGADLKKDAGVLHAAYNDAAGVTARFTLNLLARMNRELGADFNLKRFAHEAFYNPDAGRIEIYIRSLMDQLVTIAGRRIGFTAGERVHVEYSYKFSVDEFRRLALRAGFKPVDCWTDAENRFSVHYLVA